MIVCTPPLAQSPHRDNVSCSQYPAKARESLWTFTTGWRQISSEEFIVRYIVYHRIPMSVEFNGWGKPKPKGSHLLTHVFHGYSLSYKRASSSSEPEIIRRELGPLEDPYVQYSPGIKGTTTHRKITREIIWRLTGHNMSYKALYDIKYFLTLSALVMMFKTYPSYVCFLSVILCFLKNIFLFSYPSYYVS